jgi:hypothetical protein
MAQEKQEQGDKEPAPTQESDAQRVSKDEAKKVPGGEDAAEDSGAERD